MELQSCIKNTQRPFVIAGPCSAETPQQIQTIVKDLAKNPMVKMIRAGIWKPRTRPNSFEGIGSIGLPWLVNACKEVGLPCCVEIANRTHVEEAIAAGVDVLWIGARTTVNPFAVQEIADALKGKRIPVMIKNPVNPDLELWIGAFERLQQAGITDLIAIHRGFSTYKHEKYRNVPNWDLPIALKERLPHIPIICDPSHITGNRNLLLDVSQKAMDLNFDGLIIETHPTPEEAWSDAAQQVTADGLNTILQKLILRDKEFSSDLLTELSTFRAKTSDLDDRIFQLLKERMHISNEVGAFKQKNNITILQEEHWRKIIENRLAHAKDYELSNEFIREIMDAIHQESIRHQIKIMNQ